MFLRHNNKMPIIRLEDISKSLNKEVGFFPVRTRLVRVPNDNWAGLCSSNGWDGHSSGAFSPRTLTAYLKEESEFADLNILHEFFGHGLFFEYHPSGQLLVNTERRGLIGSPKISLRDIREFSELFAVWCEFYYSRQLKLEGEFDDKYKSSLQTGLGQKLLQLESIRKQVDLFGMFAMLRFPKYYDGTRIKNLIEMIFGADKVDTCRLGILYGSRKPYSDIDLFVVSGDIKDFDNEWLDVFSQTLVEFEERLRLFAVSLRDPILYGELIFGDRSYFERKREQWRTQPITEEAIRYNVKRYLELKAIGGEYPLGHKKRVIAKEYSESYLRNALLLKQGKRE